MDGDCNHETKRHLLLGRKAMTNLDKTRDILLKTRDNTLSTKVCILRGVVFPVVMYRYESWAIKKAEPKELMLSNCGVGEDSWESLGQQGYQTSQPWIFIERTDADTEAPVLWPPDAKSWLVGKDPDAGKDLGWEVNGATEDEVVGWHHWFSGREFEPTLEASEGQGSLACCSSWGRRESDTT